ncbi:MAG: hypothetical protein CMJ48_09400 [Planctomycetaceae bacterium]|nr:hypothetical protein [Planctomycetaceae bacterium]
MSFALTLALMVPLALGEEPAELRYSGSVAPVNRGTVGEPTKRFKVFYLATPMKSGGVHLDFHLEERGAGVWHWPERFGRSLLDARLAPTNKVEASLLFDHQRTARALPVRQPLFEHFDKLQEDARWKVGRVEHRVAGRERVGERECWVVEAGRDSAHGERVWVDVEQPLVVKLEKRLVRGRGDQFLLSMTLASVSPVDAPDARKLHTGFTSLLTLQAALRRREGETRSELSEVQLKLTGAMLERLRSETAQTPLAKLVVGIARDHERQSARFSNVRKLAGQHVGRPAPSVELKTLSGVPLDWKKLQGRVVVMHFWDYQSDPLEEPYGQVGYLDFLYSKRRKLGADVIGVAVREKLDVPSARSDALRSIRKLTNFMNLRYPVTADGGAALKAFGDPRSVGAELPLWVVIDHEGNVAHYHSGFYPVERNVGLKALDSVVSDLLRKRHEARSE